MLSVGRALVLTVAALAARAQPAIAAEITDVASSFDDDNPFDLRVRLSYFHDETRASIKREGEGPGQEEIIVFKDLLYAHSRDTMSVKAEVGIFQDLSFHLELPFVLGDSREYRFDQALGAGCVYPGGGSTPNCVNASNSGTISDGILPANGYDAQLAQPGMPAGFDFTQTSLVFRGTPRGGSGLDSLDTINLGLTWGPLSQRRDETKPTFILGFEAQISFGNVMKFDRARPAGNHAISEGLHRLLFRTAISKRFRYVEPYMGFWYMLPIARDESLFIDYGPTQRNKGPQQMAGTVFGFEGVPWERKERQLKVAIDVRGRIEGRFSGRGYSEGWELFASSPALDCDAKWNPSCDPNMTANMNKKYQGQPFTGLTNIDNHAILGADLAVVVQAGKYVGLHLGLQYTHTQAHIITADDVGQAFDEAKGKGCEAPTGGRVMRACEYNPAFRPVVNQIGRRYLADNLDNFRVGLWAQGMF
ncbi:MAG: hypothetical protein EXR72_19055 [Myxococcales bacterium]|nr:hypothetical protein [Myxococcales bacterium]